MPPLLRRLQLSAEFPTLLPLLIPTLPPMLRQLSTLQSQTMQFPTLPTQTMPLPTLPPMLRHLPTLQPQTMQFSTLQMHTGGHHPGDLPYIRTATQINFLYIFEAILAFSTTRNTPRLHRQRFHFYFYVSTVLFDE